MTILPIWVLTTWNGMGVKRSGAQRAPKEVAPTEEELVREHPDDKLLFGGDGKCNLRADKQESTGAEAEARRPRSGGVETSQATSRQDKEASTGSKPTKGTACCQTVRGEQNRSETNKWSDAGQVLGQPGGS